jgi:hypothetical protein
VAFQPFPEGQLGQIFGRCLETSGEVDGKVNDFSLKEIIELDYAKFSFIRNFAQ